MRTGVTPLLRVVLIGPECTGKTWLAQELAERYRVPWSPEFARRFVDEHPRPVTYADVEAIGTGQLDGERRAAAAARRRKARLVIHDTDLVSTMVYSRHYYGDCPAWIVGRAMERHAGLYLLHDIDVPWAPDGYQRAEPERREALRDRFHATLLDLGVTMAAISGVWAERRRRAVAAIDAVLGAAGS